MWWVEDLKQGRIEGSIHLFHSTCTAFRVPCTAFRRITLWPLCPRSQVLLPLNAQGDTSPQGDPELYVAAVRSLYGQYRLAGTVDASTGIRRWPPMIINTHGWIKGIGLDVLAEVLAAVNPTHLIQV